MQGRTTSLRTGVEPSPGECARPDLPAPKEPQAIALGGGQCGPAGPRRHTRSSDLGLRSPVRRTACQQRHAIDDATDDAPVQAGESQPVADVHQATPALSGALPEMGRAGEGEMPKETIATRTETDTARDGTVLETRRESLCVAWGRQPGATTPGVQITIRQETDSTGRELYSAALTQAEITRLIRVLARADRMAYEGIDDAEMDRLIALSGTAPS